MQVASHPERPHCVDYIAGLIEEFTPLAGDRLFADDKAITGGIGRFRGQSVVVIGNEALKRWHNRRIQQASAAMISA